MENYAPKLPRDRTGEAMQQYPSPRLALTTIANDNNTVSSVITLNDQTSALEIGAVGAPAVMRWLAVGVANTSVVSAAGTANFDHVIPSATYRRFVVPRETAAIASVAGINIAEGLYQRVAVRSIGIASVLTTQY